MLKVLVIEDNTEFALNLYNVLSSNKNIKIEYFCIDGNEVSKVIDNMEFDVVLLDLSLPNKTGVEILECTNICAKIPYVIIVSGDMGLIKEVYTKRIEVYKFFCKPFSLNELLNTLINIYEIKKKDNLDKKKILNKLLLNFDFNINSKGYKYIVDSLNICIENNAIILPIEKELYKRVAQANNVSNVINIKWAIQKSVKSMLRYTNKEKVKELFDFNDKPTPRVFILKLLQKVL